MAGAALRLHIIRPAGVSLAADSAFTWSIPMKTKLSKLDPLVAQVHPLPQSGDLDAAEWNRNCPCLVIVAIQL